MIPLIQSVCLNVIMAQNKHKFRSLVHLAVAIGNVIGTWFLMQVMGVVGAALMTGITLVIGHGFPYSCADVHGNADPFVLDRSL